MGVPSFISSFRSFRHVPKAALFAVFLFAVAEVVVTVAWRPSVVGALRYKTYSLSYDYAYAPDFPRLFREGDALHYYPTEYADMREFEIAREPEPREIRIFVLGSSATVAFDVPLGQAYPEQLESLLQERHPEYHWRVVNLAASGFGTTRMLNVFLNMAPHDPDAVVIHPHGTNEYEDERDARYRADLHAGLNGFFLRSRLVVLLKKLEAARLNPPPASTVPANAEQIASRDPENRARWMATMVENLRRFQVATDDLDLPTIYVGRSARDGEGYRGELVDRLNEPIDDREHFLDVAAVFAASSAEYSAGDLFLSGSHYTERGHRLVAEALYEQVRPGGEVFEQFEVGVRGESR